MLRIPAVGLALLALAACDSTQPALDVESFRLVAVNREPLPASSGQECNEIGCSQSTLLAATLFLRSDGKAWTTITWSYWETGGDPTTNSRTTTGGFTVERDTLSLRLACLSGDEARAPYRPTGFILPQFCVLGSGEFDFRAS